MTKFLKNADVTGYISQTSVTSSLVKTDANGKLVAATAGTDYQAPTTALLPAGGTAGQILSKIDATNYNTQWIDNFASQIKYEVKLGAALTKGTPVYVSSANGTNMIVSASSNATEATSSKTLGLLETGGALNDIVKVVSDGLLAGLDTSTALAGDPVWLGPSGTLLYGLANKPVAPVHMVFIGIVTRAQSVNGEIFIKVQNGFELEELHNVAISSVANNQGLFWESATSLWKNKTIAAVLGYTPVDASLTTNYIPKATGATSLGNSIFTENGGNTFRITAADAAVRLTGSTEYLLQTVDVNGRFRIYDQTAAVERLTISSTGNVGIGTNNPDSRIHAYISSGSIQTLLKLENASATASSGTKISFTEGGAERAAIISQINTGTTPYLSFENNGAERMRITSGGNLGLGVTPSAWRTTDKVIQINNGSIYDENGINFWVGQNYYENSAGAYIYLANSGASAYRQYNGQHQWFNAASGTAGTTISFTQAMTLDASGRLGIGTTSPSTILHISSLAPTFTINRLPTGTQPKISFTDNGTEFAYIQPNASTAVMRYDMGPSAAWGGIHAFFTDQSERLRINASGNVLIGTTTDAGYKLDVNGTGRYVSSSSFQGTFSGWSTAGANSASGAISLGSTAAYRGVISYAADGNTTFSFDNSYDNAGAIMQFRMRTSGTPITALSIAGTGAATFSSSVTVGSYLNIYSGAYATQTIPSIRASSANNLILNAASTGTLYLNYETGSGGVYFGNGASGLRMLLDTSGNLGLGVTPSAWGTGYKVFEFGNLSGNNSALFSNNVNDFWQVSNAYFDGTNFRYIATGTSTGHEQVNGVFKWYTAASGTAGTAISFTQAMTLNASGNLSIGNTNDTYKLDVNGTVRVSSSFNGLGFGSFGRTVDGTYRLIVQGQGTSSSTYGFSVTDSGGVQNFWVRDDGVSYLKGNVGIGTTSPSLKLDVVSASQWDGIRVYNTTASQGADIRVGNDTNNNLGFLRVGGSTSGGNNQNTLMVGTGGGYTIHIAPNGSPAITALNGGNVGIGTTSPDTPLSIVANHISGKSVLKIQTVTSFASGGTASVGFFDSDGTRTGLVYANSTGTWLETSNSTPVILSTAGNERMRITSSGNVGIGTTSPASYFGRTLTIDGATTQGIVFKDSGTDKAFIYQSANFLVLGANTDGLIFKPSDTERMRITSSGNLLIGQTGDDGYKLQVNGVSRSKGEALLGNFDNLTDFGQVGIYSTSSSWADGFGSLVLSSRSDATRPIIFTTYNGIALAERMRITSGGNVSIGNTNNTYKLDVTGNIRSSETTIIGNGASQTELQINSLGGTNQGPFIRFQKAGAAKGYIGTYSAIISGTSDDLTYYATGAQQWMTNNSATIKMTLDASGNLGIGTTSPTYKLDVVGTSGTEIIARFTASGTDIDSQINLAPTGVARGIINATANGLAFAVAGSTKALITSSGNVGIGTTSPGYKLQMINAADGYAFGINGGAASSTYYAIYLGDGGMSLGTRSNHKFSIFTNDTDRLTVSTTGLVGIGTSSPYQLLTNNGHIGLTTATAGTDTTADVQRAAIGWQATGSTGVLGAFITAANQGSWGADMQFFTRGSSGGNASERMRITSAGNVGIGVTPSNWSSGGKIEMIGNSAIIMQSDYANFGANNYYNGGFLRISTGYATNYYQAAGNHIFQYAASGAAGSSFSFSEAMRIDTSGRLGIGTSSPSHKLTVQADSADMIIWRSPTYISGILGLDTNNSHGAFWLLSSGVTKVQISALSTTPTYFNAGNVLIGTTNDSGHKLSIAGNVKVGGTSTYNTIEIHNSGLSGGGGMIAYQNGVTQGYFGALAWYLGGTDVGAIIGTDSASRPIVFYTSTERMRITGAGNVGIGTTSPTGKLHVKGNIYIERSSIAESSIITMEAGEFDINASPYGYNMRFFTGTGGTGAERMRITTGGALQLNGAATLAVLQTNSDANSIHIVASTSLADAKPRIELCGTSHASSANTTFYRAGTQVFTSSTASTEYMRLTSAGNVGIGTTSPGKKLDVSASDENVLRLQRTGVSARQWDINISPNFKIGDNTAAADRLVIDTSGNVGIGTTSPSFATGGGLVVKTGATDARIALKNTASGDASTDGFQLVLTTALEAVVENRENGSLRFLTNATEAARFTAGQNLLIGDTADYLATKLYIKSAGSTSSTNILACLNSLGTDYFRVRSDGYTYAKGVYDNTTSSGANVFVGSGGDFLRSTSSIKYKKNVLDYSKGLAEIMQMRAVTYEGKSKADEGKIFAGLIAEEIHDLGLTEFVQYAEDGTPDALAYQNMVSLLIKGMQELKTELDTLKNK